MKSLIVYESRFGNTALLARTIADELRTHGAAHLLSVEEVTTTDLDGIDLLVVGGPTHGHGVSAQIGHWLKRLPEGQLRDLPAAAFDTRYRMARFLTGSAAHGIARRLGQRGANAIAPPASFFIAAGEGPLADGEVERAATWARGLAARTSALHPAATPAHHAVPGEHWQPHQ